MGQRATGPLVSARIRYRSCAGTARGWNLVDETGADICKQQDALVFDRPTSLSVPGCQGGIRFCMLTLLVTSDTEIP